MYAIRSYYALKEVVRQVKKSIRKDDQLIRWGGEEFIVIIVTHSQILLEGVAENLRRQIETTAFEAIGALTCSFGVTLHRKNELITQTVKRADEALYAAKEGGRNRTVLIRITSYNVCYTKLLRFLSCFRVSG